MAPSINSANEAGPGHESKELVFAGISGLPPRYFDSGPNKGLGWLEYHTKNILKQVTQAGFKFTYEYYTAARLEHEFQRKAPICFYPAEWKSTKEVFANRPDRIYSIPLDFEADQNHSILIRKSDRQRFERHLDSKGDVNIEQLLRDSTLKTLLVQDASYDSRISDLLLVRGASGLQEVKPVFKKNVSILLIKDNQQLVEMLNANRFDYIFSASIESQSFFSARLDLTRFEFLNFETHQSKDPEHTIKRSVVCSDHPVSRRALPFFNLYIKTARSHRMHMRMIEYQRKLDPGIATVSQDNSIQIRFADEINKGEFDRWYARQQDYFPGLRMFPEERTVDDAGSKRQTVSSSYVSRDPVKWLAFTDGQRSWLMLPASEVFGVGRFESSLNLKQASPFWHKTGRSTLPESVPRSIRSQLRVHSAPRYTSHDFSDLLRLILEKDSPITLVAFAGPLSESSAVDFSKTMLEHPHLKDLTALTFFDLGPDQSAAVISHLPSQISSLNLTQCSLIRSRLGHFLPRLRLKSLGLGNAQMEVDDALELFEKLQPGLEFLDLSFSSRIWQPKAIPLIEKAFREKFQSLKGLNLENSLLTDYEIKKTLAMLPPSLERLNLNGNHLTPASLSLILNGNFNRLLDLRLHLNPIADSESNQIKFPSSLVNLDLSDTCLTSDSAKRLLLPRTLKAFRLGHTRSNMVSQINELTDHGTQVLLSQIGGGLEELDLNSTGAGKETLTHLSSGVFARLRYLSLDGNRIGLETLKHINFERLKALQFLTLKNNLLGTEAATLLARSIDSNSIPIVGIDLSLNPFGQVGIRSLAQYLPRALEELYLSDLAEFQMSDLESLLDRTANTLKSLDISENGLGTTDLLGFVRHFPKALSTLNMSGSSFGNQSLLELSKNIPRSLSSLELANTPMSITTMAELLKALPSSIARLDIGPFFNDTGGPFSLGLGELKGLNYLILNGILNPDPITPITFTNFPSAVQHLLFGNSSISDSQLKAVADSWPWMIRFFSATGVSSPHGLEIIEKGIPSTLQELWFLGPVQSVLGTQLFFSHPLAQLESLVFKLDAVSAKELCSKPRNIYHLALQGSGDDETLRLLNSNCLARVKGLWIGAAPLTGPAIISAIKGIHRGAAEINLPSTQLQFKDVSALLGVLPPQVIRFTISGNKIGQSGYELIRKFARQRKEKTGVPFEVVE